MLKNGGKKMNLAKARWRCEICKKNGTVDIYMFGKASAQMEKIDSDHSAKSPGCPGKTMEVTLK